MVGDLDAGARRADADRAPRAGIAPDRSRADRSMPRRGAVVVGDLAAALVESPQPESLQIAPEVRSDARAGCVAPSGAGCRGRVSIRSSGNGRSSEVTTRRPSTRSTRKRAESSWPTPSATTTWITCPEIRRVRSSIREPAIAIDAPGTSKDAPRSVQPDGCATLRLSVRNGTAFRAPRSSPRESRWNGAITVPRASPLSMWTEYFPAGRESKWKEPSRPVSVVRNGALPRLSGRKSWTSAPAMGTPLESERTPSRCAEWPPLPACARGANALSVAQPKSSPPARRSEARADAPAKNGATRRGGRVRRCMGDFSGDDWTPRVPPVTGNRRRGGRVAGKISAFRIRVSVLPCSASRGRRSYWTQRIHLGSVFRDMPIRVVTCMDGSPSATLVASSRVVEPSPAR